MTITPKPATETGAVAGFEATCPECGLVLTNTFESSLRLDADSHLEWHRKEGR